MNNEPTRSIPHKRKARIRILVIDDYRLRL